MTGTMAVVHHTPWLAELDDSIERYLSEPENDVQAVLNDGESVLESKP